MHNSRCCISLGVISGVALAILAAPSVALADSSATAPSPTAEQRRQLAISDQRTTRALVREAMKLTSTVDPKAAKGAAAGRWGTYPTRKGTFLSTNTKFAGLIPTGHSAMVISSSWVIESLSGGVQWGYNNWYSTKPQAWGMTTRATTSTQDAYAADWVRWQVGKPYNYNYYDMGTRSRFYCSQLVWASFRDTTGIDLNTSAYDALGFRAIHPMEFPSSANSTKISTFYVK